MLIDAFPSADMFEAKTETCLDGTFAPNEHSKFVSVADPGGGGGGRGP